MRLSLTKRIWFDRDPAYEDIRQRIGEENQRYIEQFKFRAPLNRRNKLADRPHWDPIWPSSLDRAAEELKIEVVRVNEGIFFRTREQRDATKRLAEVLWRKNIEARKKKE